MRIELLGTSFTIETDEEPEYLERIVRYYQERVEEIESSVSTTDPLKKAILAAILSIDELFSLREERGDGREIEQITDRLLRTLDETLEEGNREPRRAGPPEEGSSHNR
ncbi:MAG: cell division protein ZapA [Alkalispirochaetaceae bacterium]